MSEIKPVRRIVTVEDHQGKEIVFADGPSPDVTTDPARPGYSETRLWLTNQNPARIKGVTETLDAPPAVEPPSGGSVCRMVTFPPDGVTPAMRETETLDFCIVMEGEITLVLDSEEVQLSEGDSIVQRGSNHAWVNRSDKPCTMFFSLHDGTFD
jgi:quercetin dioxygenase-like cupin family protein